MGTMKGGGNGGGEIVQVQGGHIVRATGRKDRHSKVYTSKGPRDRRVRLSAHTAIQFYDVQDRLGFDRPSKAVDWLITKAKTSIETLANLPPRHPTTTPNPQPPPNHVVAVADQTEPPECAGYEASSGADGGGGGGSSSFLPPPPEELDSDSMKLFFPAEQSGQDLGLSLYSSNFHGGQAAASLFAAPEPDGFGGSGGAYQRLMGWPGGSSAGLGLQAVNHPRGSVPFPSSSSPGGFFLINQNMNMSSSTPHVPVPQSSGSSSSSRVPLQSSNLHLSPIVPSSWLGGFDEFRRFNISEGLVAFGFQGRDQDHNGAPHSTSPNSGHHHPQ